MLDSKTRYLQIAFNDDLGSAMRIVPALPKDPRILIEAGTPFIKREGVRGISTLASLWGGKVIADIKTADGGSDEVAMVRYAGASGATVIGSAPIETVDFFVQACKRLGMDSFIDMIGVSDPLKIVRKLKSPPDVVVLHRGRDEESNRAKLIDYKQVNRLRSKYDVRISAAGGVDLREARSAIFNGANIVVVNIVKSGNPWAGIKAEGNVVEVAKEFLKTIE